MWRPSRLAASSEIALAKSLSVSMYVSTNCRCSERSRAAGSRRIAIIFASGHTDAMRCGAVRDHRYKGEVSPITWSPPASANQDRYCSSVRGVPSRRGGVRSSSSVAKNHASLLAGMNMAGWRRSMSDSAVVPLLGWPTMKKSGTRPGARTDARDVGAESRLSGELTLTTPQSRRGRAEGDLAPRPREPVGDHAGREPEERAERRARHDRSRKADHRHCDDRRHDRRNLHAQLEVHYALQLRQRLDEHRHQQPDPQQQARQPQFIEDEFVLGLGAGSMA